MDKISKAREHLGKAESNLFSEDADYHVEEGFAMLEQIEDEGCAESDVARNLGHTYFKSFYGKVKEVSEDAPLTKPQLDGMLGVAGALEGARASAGSDIGKIKIQLVERLFRKILAGYSDQEKIEFWRRLGE